MAPTIPAKWLPKHRSDRDLARKHSPMEQSMSVIGSMTKSKEMELSITRMGIPLKELSRLRKQMGMECTLTVTDSSILATGWKTCRMEKARRCWLMAATTLASSRRA